jgi:hypothetical protein
MKEQRIASLRRAIASESTPKALKEQMEIELGELLKPEPPAPIVVEKPKKKPVDLSQLPHAKYMEENSITVNDLSMPIRKKINGLRMFMGKDSEKVKAKSLDISTSIVDMIKAHITPPEPPKPERVYTQEEKDKLTAEYKARKLKRKESGYY